MLSGDDFYETLYGEMQSSGAQGWYVAIAHRQLENHLGDLPPDAKILEVGGNKGEHCRYVGHAYSSYLVTDSRDVRFSPGNERIRFEVADVEALPYAESGFDRVICTCLLHHLVHPEQGLREMRRVVKPGGLISIQLPCDPGLAYRIAKAIGPNRKLRNLGLTSEPSYFHYLNHRNHFPGLDSIIRHVFRDDIFRTMWWPFPVPSWNLNLFKIMQIRLRK